MIEAFLWCNGEASTLPINAIADAVKQRRPENFLWVHIHASKMEPAALDELGVALPPAVTRALTAVETRPRCELIGDGVLINMRVPPVDGVGAPERGSDILVSMRLWAENGLVLSVSYRRTKVLDPLHRLFLDGSLHDPGDLVIALAMLGAEDIDNNVAAIGDSVDDLECAIDQTMHTREANASRRSVTHFRTEAIAYRRFVVPQRRALDTMATLPLGWLDDNERAALREASDRYARMGEELESVRERAAVIHEELTDLRAERIDTRSLRIAVVATIFLPLTFITGLLGMNVAGIPDAQDPWAFTEVTVGCIVFAIGLYCLLMRRNGF